VLMPTGEVRQADGLTWRAVRDAYGAAGWVAADYLTQV
jgi:SH3-like domain-containing protein